jgi:hypothetical protein
MATRHMVHLATIANSTTHVARGPEYTRRSIPTRLVTAAIVPFQLRDLATEKLYALREH